MTDLATAPAGSEPTAIEPERVLVLTDDEQHALIDAIAAAQDMAVGGGHVLAVDVAYRIRSGDRYANPVDELTRVTLRKRRLEHEIRRCNQAIERASEQVIDDLIDRGENGVKHAATGASIVLTRKVWAKLAVDVPDDMPRDEVDALKADAKAAAARALVEADLGDYVREDFNLNSISAYFREQVKAYDAEQAELPEHKRAPRPVSSFLPEPLQGLIVLDDAPTVQVRASRS